MSEGMVERLALLEPDWADVERRSQRLHKQHLRKQAILTLGLFVAAAVLAGGAYAAVRIWMGHDMTPADVDRQATVVTNDKWAICSGHNQCTTRTGSHEEITILPSMGVVFVLPGADGYPDYSLSVVPAAGAVEVPPSGWGSISPLLDSSGHGIGGVWTLQRHDGSKYDVTWHSATGSVTERITNAAGASTHLTLRAGDVVPLIPGSTATDSRTLDKAVTFDLPTGNLVVIFPQLNETYIDGVQTPQDARKAQPFAPGEAAKYGLTPIGVYNGKLPVTTNGGSWTTHLPGGLTRTISWHAGDSFVTVEDTTPKGTTTAQVPIGHELPLVPFK